MDLHITDIVTKLPSNGSNGTRPLARIKYAIIHHDAATVEEGYDHIDRYHRQANYHIRKGWKRLAYHIRIASDGTVYLTNRFEEITWHAGNYRVNLRALGICLDGDFRKQKPTTEQVASLWQLLTYLTTERPDMPDLLPKTVKGHREVRFRYTSCPSNTILNLVKAFRV